jgi:hypothetical protein
VPLLYRAVWEDESHNPQLVLNDEFRSWCRSKGLEDIDIPYRGTLATGRVTVDVRRGDAESGGVLRTSLTETDATAGRTWITTATAITTPAFRGYWVDVECVTERDERIPIAAPRLVRMILAEDGTPHRGPVPISTRRRRIVRGHDIDELLELLSNPDRDLPVVVFSPDLRAGASLESNIAVNDERASLAAEILAGLARVYLLSPGGAVQFNEALPEGLRVYGGAVRAYLPGFTTADDPYRHRYWGLWSLRQHPRRAGQLIAQHLSRLQHLINPPSAWSTVRSLVARPTEEESAERREEISRELPGGASDVAEFSVRQDELLRRIVQIERERDQVLQDLESETRTLRRRVATLEDEHLDDAAALEDLAEENRALRRNLKMLVAPHVEAVVEAPVSIDDLDVPQQSIDVVELAVEYLDLVVMHPKAPRDVEKLDESAKDRVWALGAWQGLCALQRYAEAARDGEDTGGFYVWCERTGEWPTSKVAMVESETVMNGDLARHRLLPVSELVDPSGFMVMQAHLKIQPGGGQNIPRLYFHDDTKGRTGQIHVGFFGPHYLMPNTRTN